MSCYKCRRYYIFAYGRNACNMFNLTFRHAFFVICVLAEFSLNDNGINSSFCTNIEFEPILHYTERMMFFLSTWGVVPA